MKCVRNNWINQKDENVSFFFPNFDNVNIHHTASFKTIRKLYDVECDKLLKFGYGLTLKALWPTNIEKQNVKLVLQIFSEFVSEALRELGPSKQLLDFNGTGHFLEIILSWWKIVNVKTPYVGSRQKDNFKNPITNSEDDVNVKYLNDFLNWLDAWNTMSIKNKNGFLTKETFFAIVGY